jgi:hypothetical protein
MRVVVDTEIDSHIVVRREWFDSWCLGFRDIDRQARVPRLSVGSFLMVTSLMSAPEKTTVETDRYVTVFQECQAPTAIRTTLVKLEVRFVVRETPEFSWFESESGSFVDSDESTTELQRGVRD